MYFTDRFVIDNFSDLLLEGQNVLAIQAHNISGSSSDFTIIPFLSAIFSAENTSGVTPPEILNLVDDNHFHTNFKISSNSGTIIFSDPNNIVVDELTGEFHFSNNLVRYLQTTPTYQNSDEEFLGSVQNEILFSEESGLKSNPISLSLSGESLAQTIRFTTDGSEPNNLSQDYTGQPISITNNTSIKAKLFQNNYLPSPTYTASYIIGSNHELDVLLMTVDQDDFFDEETGIYVFGPEGTYDIWEPYFGATFFIP